MAFWDLFNSDNKKDENYKHGLYQKAKDLFPEENEGDLIKWTCIAGLLARVAYSDLNVDESETTYIKTALNEFSHFDQKQSNKLTDLAIEEIKTLAGQENHRYCYELNELIDADQKFSLLKILFAVAASDGEVESVESEEIRHITKALLLEHKHYVAARATVLDSLKTLKK